MPQIKDCSLDINLNTELKGILDAANFGTSWSKKRQDACNKIETLIKKFNGYVFQGDQRTYGELSTRGSHKVFLVPADQTRKLKNFRGKLILLICIGYADKWPSYSNRQFAALLINKSGELVKNANVKTK